jgi:hypothetical protein
MPGHQAIMVATIEYCGEVFQDTAEVGRVEAVIFGGEKKT